MLRHSPHGRRLVCEVLEARTLLSVGLAPTAVESCLPASSAADAAQPPIPAELPAAQQQPISPAIGHNQSAYRAVPGVAGANLAKGPITFDSELQETELKVGTSAYWFGEEVALSGNTLVAAGSVSSSLGAVYVFTGSGASWSLKATLTDGAAGDNFGASLAISGNTVVVGASGTASTPGTAYVYTEPGTGWANMSSPTAKLTASDGAAGDNFGTSVAISGNTVVIGASGTASTPGAAYVYTEPATGWTSMNQTAELTASDGAAGDSFGGVGCHRRQHGAGWRRNCHGRRQHPAGGGLRVHGTRCRLDEHEPFCHAYRGRRGAVRLFRQLGFDQRQHGGGRARTVPRSGRTTIRGRPTSSQSPLPVGRA